MKKKILLASILVVFMLVTISMATAAINKNVERKESPLFGVRTNRAVNEKLQDFKEIIKTRFFGERLFFLSLPLIKTTETDNYGPSLIITGCGKCPSTGEYTLCPSPPICGL